MGIQCPKCQHENPDDTVYCGKCATPLKSAEEISITKTLIKRPERLQKGSTIGGRYQILEELGRGGMGVVYKAEDTKLKRTVALKLLPPELTHISEVKERFVREAQAAAALDHPNICTVYEFDEADETNFISMAYIEGQSLKKKIESGPLELDEAIRIALQVAEGLQKAHKNGVVHRDIKSSNIMVTEEGQAKIMDFGLARMTGGTLITKEGMAMGTIAYMSPEQARGEEVDHRTDIWSLGVVLYEMFGGQLPFKGDQDQAVVYSILNKQPKPITDLRAEIPMSLGQVVAKALEKNPDERYQKVEELLDDLKSISAGIVPDEIRARLRKAKLRRRKRSVLYAGTACFLILMTVIALSLFTGRAKAIDSIAVLPLKNLTGDAEQEYFVDVATDELIGQLSQISGLRRVISRTTVMKYKGVEKPLPEIARELNVDAVVEGSVYQVGENVRIRVHLIDALPEERKLWAQTYNRPMTDVLLMYSEMARAIAGKIQVKLTAEETTRLASARQVNPKAYEACTQGRIHWYKLTAQDLETALEYFESALEIDPNYALAHAGVALVWVGRNQRNLAPRNEAVSLANAAADKAVELDNTLAEAHYALALIRAWSEWDWEGAETAFKRAIEFNPNFPDVHAYYSQFLSHMGRLDEALLHIERTIELDPLNALFHGLYGNVLLYQRRYDDAIAAANTGLALDPGLMVARSALQYGYTAKGMYEEQLAIQRARIALDPELVAAFERGLKEGGYKGVQRAIADVLAARYGKTGKGAFGAVGIARRYLDAGDYDRAIDWLEKGYVNRDPNLPYIGLPFYDPLRSDPRFLDLLRRMGLPVDEKK
jgi:TolB-like protein/Tfp pilus assembly protein PilF/predicted Ser/Thr protein kinase